ncbi:MAG: hypothetical protein JNL11_16660 [Bdellovibrionaceae bacterium]|nr:hypothetical protein [Pseudobdellovibrionaceae bacterium]
MAMTRTSESLAKKFSIKLFLHLIRALFPRWDFFDQTGFAFELYFKAPQSLSWEYFSFIQDHKKACLIFNPALNEALALYGIVEQFAHDVQNQNDVQQLTSFRLLCAVLKAKLLHEYPGYHSVQFKIIARNQSDAIQIYASDTIAVESL